MADRMTREQVAELRLPEGATLRLRNCHWVLEVTRIGPVILLAPLAAAAANGYVPKHVWDLALAAYEGKPVPTPEQWEAAVRLAAIARDDAHPDSIVTKLANIISPPKPPPLPEIAACPFCGSGCTLTHNSNPSRVVVCTRGGSECWYNGPLRDTDAGAIEAHNDVARKLSPEPQPEPGKRTCGECAHFKSSDARRPCCHNMSGYGPGQGHVTLAHPSPTRDASECERWEPKP